MKPDVGFKVETVPRVKAEAAPDIKAAVQAAIPQAAAVQVAVKVREVEPLPPASTRPIGLVSAPRPDVVVIPWSLIATPACVW